jgi:chorismate mutase
MAQGLYEGPAFAIERFGKSLAVSVSEPSAVETLADLRVDIDRIDASMHELLMERGRIIDRLIAIKARQGGGSAFRPAREAAMMRALAERHCGLLPLDTVESIWRIIISTFTFVQSNYQVHVDMSHGDAPMRDSARFHFGFTVPCIPHDSVGGVIEAVARGSGDLGMFALDGGAGAGAWWTRLCPACAPKIIARLPLVERPNHPAGMPVFVIARPLAEGAARDIVIESVSLDRWRGDYPEALGALGGEIIGNAADGMGLSLLIARPGALEANAIVGGLRDAGAGDLRISEVGAHAARFDSSAAAPSL